MKNEMITKQYLTFNLDKEHYAIDVSNIREVLEFQTVSIIPGMPAYMRGIINLRGNVVPVIDLKMKFGLGKTEKKTDTSVIVTEVKLSDGEIVMGLLTDSISEVVDIEADQIEPAPNIGTAIDSSFIQGMGKKGDVFIILLDINKVLSSDELSELTAEQTVSV